MSACDQAARIFSGCWGAGSVTVCLQGGTTYYVIVDNFSGTTAAASHLRVDPSARAVSHRWHSAHHTAARWHLRRGTRTPIAPGTSVARNACTASRRRPRAITRYPDGSKRRSGLFPDERLRSEQHEPHRRLLGLGAQTVCLQGGHAYYVIVDNYSASSNAGYSCAWSRARMILARVPRP